MAANSLDAERLFRAVNNYARNHDFIGGFPAFFEAWSNGKQVFGVYFLQLAERGWVSGDCLKDVETASDLFQAVDVAAHALGFGVGFPTYTRVENEHGVHQEVIFVETSQTDTRILDAVEIGLCPDDQFEGKIKKLQAYARTHGYRAALPCGSHAREHGKIAIHLFSGNVLTWKVLTEAELDS